MELIGVAYLVQLVVALIMILPTIALLLHIFKGNKNKWLAINTMMLLVHNIGGVTATYYNNQYYNKGQKTVLNLLLLQFSNKILMNMTFNVSHFLIAVKYR